MPWLKVLTVWLGILVFAVLNGTLREAVLVPAFGKFAGMLGSGIILSSCIFLAAFFAAPWFGRRSAAQFWLIGASWLVLTLLFEIGIGLAQQRDPSELFQAYTFENGNIWPVVLAAALASPWLAGRLRGLTGRADG